MKVLQKTSVSEREPMQATASLAAVEHVQALVEALVNVSLERVVGDSVRPW